MTAPQQQLMTDSESFGDVQGGGEFKFVVNFTICLEDNNNCCRRADCCCDGGCLELEVVCQQWCLKWSKNGFEIVAGLPCVEDQNFCRTRCCCCDSGCTKFGIKCQVLCLQCGDVHMMKKRNWKSNHNTKPTSMTWTTWQSVTMWYTMLFKF